MMRRISLALLATTAVGAIACQGALAADLRMPVKAAPVAPPPVQDWSGVYVGVEGGYGWGHQSVNAGAPFGLTPSDTTCTPGGANGPYYNDCEHHEFKDFQHDFDSLSLPNLATSGHNQSGGVVGGFFGVQKQWGSWVLGFEGSVDYAHITSSQSVFATSSVSVNDCGECTASEGRFTRATNAVSFTSTIDEIGAVNAKVGYAWSPNWLIYGTGGMAFAHEKNSVSIGQSLFHLDCDTGDANECDARNGSFNPATDGGTFDGFTAFASQSFAGSGGTTLFGWTAGAGIDYKWQIDAGSAWVFGIDYKHYGFPNHTFTMANNNNGGSFSFNASENIDVIKGRISYLFSIH
jgi:outer membrane immunogenic protein